MQSIELDGLSELGVLIFNMTLGNMFLWFIGYSLTGIVYKRGDNPVIGSLILISAYTDLLCVLYNDIIYFHVLSCFEDII